MRRERNTLIHPVLWRRHPVKSNWIFSKRRKEEEKERRETKANVSRLRHVTSNTGTCAFDMCLIRLVSPGYSKEGGEECREWSTLKRLLVEKLVVVRSKRPGFSHWGAIKSISIAENCHKTKWRKTVRERHVWAFTEMNTLRPISLYIKLDKLQSRKKDFTCINVFFCTYESKSPIFPTYIQVVELCYNLHYHIYYNICLSFPKPQKILYTEEEEEKKRAPHQRRSAAL